MTQAHLRPASTSLPHSAGGTARGPSRRAPRLVLALTALGLASCATTAPADGPPTLEDQIIIPEAAAAVEQIYLFKPDKSASLNQHMAIVWSQSKPYLLVSDDGCTNLGRNDVHVATTLQRESALHAGTMLLVDGQPCHIDRIYRISSEDATSLRKTFAR